MQLKYIRTIQPASKSPNRVTCMSWALNSRKLAVADWEGQIHMFDENYEKRDKFWTKSSTGKRGNYLIKGMVFSPDDTKLAVAQSDNIVYIYKLGVEWGEKKSICNKFQQTSSVTCICWPVMHPNEIVFGTAEGKVKVGNLRNNKGGTLYGSEYPVVSLASSPDGHGIISAHSDGSIYRFYFKELDPETNLSGSQKIIQLSSVPLCLTWAESIVVASSDSKIAFFNKDGILQQQFDFSSSKLDKEYSSITSNPAGQSIVVGAFNRYRLFNYNVRRSQWEEGESQIIQNYYSITSLAWKPDGSKLALGSLTGLVDIYDTCIKRYKYKGEFEFTFVSSSQVIVRRIPNGSPIVLKSYFGYEIMKVNVSRDQYLVAFTPRTLLLGDLESCKLSEVPWSITNTEKFIFDNPKVCLVYNAGELTIVEYGINDIIGSFRTEHISTHLISVCISYPPEITNQSETRNDLVTPIDEGNKKVAYLIDSHTIRIMDLVSSVLIAKINHDSKIDWLELNSRGTKLLFRDKMRLLHLFDIKTQQRITLLSYCSYVQWVPDADVVVAQNRSDLCVWYSIDAPDRVTIVPIKGEVEDIVRSQGCTAVVVDEGPGTVNYDLDEGLIEFGSAMQDKDFARAADILEQLSLTPETEAMWKNLSDLVLKDMKFHIAERCFSAIGDIAKARYLRKIVKKIQRIEADEEEMSSGIVDPLDHWKIRAKLAVLRQDFKTAEQLYLEQGQFAKAMRMYEKVHKFEESIAIAIAKNVPNAEEKKKKYVDWLINTKQEDKAAKVYIQEGKYVQAINLYIQGGFPASAANVVTKFNLSGSVQEKLLDSISLALVSAGLHEKAGEFFEKRGLNDKAIDAYRKGCAFRNAVELARSVFPDMVVSLEEEWGDYLNNQKQVEAAIHHYIEAGQYKKAIQAAITSRQWTKAIQILEGLDPSDAMKYYVKVARYYEEIQNYALAKKYYLKAGKPKDALDMYKNANMWNDVQDIAEMFMGEKEIQELYLGQATRLESKQKFKEAEALYLKIHEPDLAINMYKKNHMFDDMIRLVSQHRNSHLSEAHTQIAQQLEREGHLRQAEHHYIQAGDWINAVNMYRTNDKWNDAIRIAKGHGPANSWKKVAIEWAVTTGGESGGEAGAKLLAKLGLIEEAINYCLERDLWTLAFDMARTSLRSKLPEVHLKYAMVLEDAGRFKEAEEEYINGQSPKEAIEMYIHISDWNNAMRVAENFDTSLIAYVLEQQADVAFNNGEYERAEKLFTQAKKPEKIIQKYKEINRFNDAKRIAEQYLSPDAQRKLTSDWAEYLNEASDDTDFSAPARMFKESGQYSKAIDAYLSLQYNKDITDIDYLISEWENAVDIAAHHYQSRLIEVVIEVSKRMKKLGRYKNCIDLLVSVDMIQEAIETCVEFSFFEQAIQLAKAKKPELLAFVQQQHKVYLTSNKKSDETTKGVSAVALVEDFIQKGDWKQALQHAQKLNDVAMFQKYLASAISRECRNNKILNAVSIVDDFGPPKDLSIINDLVKRALWSSSEQKEAISSCRKILFSISSNATSNSERSRYMNACHLLWMKLSLDFSQLMDLYTAITVSLLRYSDLIPADKAFYEAGMACKQQNQKDMAVVFFNRFLDISEEIENMEDKRNNDTEELVVECENADFQDTDIPYKIALPRQSCLSEQDREDVTTFVLVEAVDDKVQSMLPRVTCDVCGKEKYAAGLLCLHCSTTYECCVLSGYPVTKAEKVSCSSCNRPANRKFWNTYFMKYKTCPACDEPQSLRQ